MHYHLLGSGLILWSCWQISTLIGIIAGPTIPDNFQLGFAVPLTFIAVVIPSLTRFPQIFAGVSSGTAALIFQFLPFNLWIIISAICGIIAGTASSYLMDSRDTKTEEKP